MVEFVSDIAFTESVKARQERNGSRQSVDRTINRQDWSNEVSDDLAAFLAQRDSFYFATASANGQPYVQHRGGPPGFLKVLDKRTLGFADFSGNRQYISQGNLDENDRAHIFIMDYANRQRVKLWGRAEAIEGDQALIDRLSDPTYPGKVERAILFHIDAWDINCPQHILRRFDENTVAVTIAKLRAKNEELQNQVNELLGQVDSH